MGNRCRYRRHEMPKGKSSCTVDACICPCTLYFKKRKVRELRIQYLEEKEKETDKMAKMEPGTQGKFFSEIFF